MRSIGTLFASIKDTLTLEYNPWTQPEHYKDTAMTTKREKNKRGESQDKPRSERGLAMGYIERKNNVIPINL